MSKIRIRTVQYFEFYCPACKRIHTVSDIGGWSVGYDLLKPTITPSVLNQTPILNEITGVYEMKQRCHLNITNGMIYYHSDSAHEMAGQTVELPEIS
jgi:hypothetical protein